MVIIFMIFLMIFKIAKRFDFFYDFFNDLRDFDFFYGLCEIWQNLNKNTGPQPSPAQISHTPISLYFSVLGTARTGKISPLRGDFLCYILFS